MLWSPYLLAVIFGLLVSALLYFVLLWPGREPPEPPADPDDSPPG
ncbi:hypothetical protein [Haliangium sp.]